MISTNGNALADCSDTLDDLITEYVERFRQNFPIFAVKAMPEDDLKQLLKSCFQNNTPYHPERINPYDALY